MGRIRKTAIDRSGMGGVTKIFDPNAKESNCSVNEIMTDDSIDAVFICTPNNYNFSLTMQALKNSKHVFCEKPPALTVEEVLQIQKLEAKSGMKLMYGLNHRHHGSIKKMKSMIDSQNYGKVLWMRGRYGKSVDESFYNDWRSKKETAGGGILMDQGIHMVDLLLHLGGQFDEYKALISSLYWKLDVEDNAFVIMRNNETGVVASLHSTMTQWRHLFSLEVFLEKGYFVLNGLKTSSGTYGQEILTVAKNRSQAPAATWKDEEKISFPIDDSWDSEVSHFLESISSNTEILLGSSYDALRVMEALESIYASDPHIQAGKAGREDQKAFVANRRKGNENNI